MGLFTSSIKECAIGTTMQTLIHSHAHMQFYDLGEMAALAELPGAFILGAAAVSSRVAGSNGEVSRHHASYVATKFQ